MHHMDARQIISVFQCGRAPHRPPLVERSRLGARLEMSWFVCVDTGGGIPRTTKFDSCGMGVICFVSETALLNAVFICSTLVLLHKRYTARVKSVRMCLPIRLDRKSVV